MMIPELGLARLAGGIWELLCSCVPLSSSQSHPALLSLILDEG